MKPFKKILVPTDFSVHSAEALRYAADLSKRYEGSLLLLHVYQPVAYALPDGYVLYTEKQFAAMMSEFENQLEKAKADALAAGATRVETRMFHGVASTDIVGLAGREDFDLIVMGTHGRTGVKHVLVGSVAERVVRKAPCPVLTVHLPERG